MTAQGSFVLLFGVGAGRYAVVNSIGWALQNSVPAAVHMCFGAIVSLAVLAVLARDAACTNRRHGG